MWSLAAEMMKNKYIIHLGLTWYQEYKMNENYQFKHIGYMKYNL